MATFILRVKLTNENEANYTYIRDKLMFVGFSKRIKSTEGIEYRLPNGNYIVDSDYPANDILDTVKEIVFAIDKTPQIVLSEVSKNATHWYGLQKC